MLLEHWEHGNGRGIILPSRSSPSMRGMHTHEITRRVAWARIGRVFGKRYFSKESIQMVFRHMEKCSTLLVIREMQTKTIMRQCITPTRLAVLKRKEKQVLVRITGTLTYCWCECKMIQLLWKTL